MYKQKENFMPCCSCKQDMLPAQHKKAPDQRAKMLRNQHLQPQSLHILPLSHLQFLHMQLQQSHFAAFLLLLFIVFFVVFFAIKYTDKYQTVLSVNVYKPALQEQPQYVQNCCYLLFRRYAFHYALVEPLEVLVPLLHHYRVGMPECEH
jgi:hypothetical protein